MLGDAAHQQSADATPAVRAHYDHVGVDLSSPLRTLSPGLDSAVLQVLAGTESGLSASQIARLAPRGSRAGQQPVLNRLVEHGFVIAEPANLGSLYRLNREHVLSGPVAAAATARVMVLARLTGAVESLRPAPLHASLFGSFARGEAGPDSDIDLLVVTLADADLEDEAWFEQLDELHRLTESWNDDHERRATTRQRQSRTRHS